MKDRPGSPPSSPSLTELGSDDWPSILEDPDRLPAAVRDLLERENARVEEALAPVAGLREALRAEMWGRLDLSQPDPPVRRGPWVYHRRRDPSNGHPVFSRRAADAPALEVPLWSAPPDRPAGYLEVRSARPSPDHRWFAVAVDTRGSEAFSIVLCDPEAPGSPAEVVENTNGAFAWSRDGRVLFYIRATPGTNPREVLRHRLGTAAATDEVVYREEDPRFFLGLTTTEAGSYVVIEIESYETTELRLVDAARPFDPPRVLFARQPGVRYAVSEQGSSLLVLTNVGGADDNAIVRCSPDATCWSDTVVEVPHRPGRWIRELLAFEDHLVTVILEDARPHLVIRGADGREQALDFEDPNYDLSVDREIDVSRGVLRVAYSSPRSPREVIDIELRTGTRSRVHRDRVPSGHDRDAYVVERLDAPASDGAHVPVTVLRRHDTPRDGSAPLVVVSYGAYGMVLFSGFRPHRLGLVDRGFVIALVHPRGGRDKGHGWYTAGKLEHKRNTFTDTMAAIEHLVAQGHGRRGEVTFHSASAGGLVAGYLVNEHAEWFRAVVGEVPFVDILRTMSDPTLPLTAPEWSEWGNPLRSAAERERIAAYSPCDNVRRQAQPHVLATAGIADPRVGYWEPARWIGQLRTHQQGRSMLLLQTELGGGHAGFGGPRQRIEELSRAHAFILHAAGWDD